MRQLSLIDDEYTTLSGAMPLIKAALRRVAGDENSEGRKLLVDKINKIARISGVKLTGGNVRAISKDTLDKWLSPSDESHPPKRCCDSRLLPCHAKHHPIAGHASRCRAGCDDRRGPVVCRDRPTVR